MKHLAKIALLGAIALGCEKSRQFPIEPFVKLEKYDLVAANVDPNALNEHIALRFYFTDGDGNIGLEEGDTLPPFCNTCEHYDNLRVNVYSKIDGVFELNYPYNARIKNLTPNGQNLSLEGHMDYKIDIANRTSDTIMVDFYLEDRDLNQSNVERTPELYVKF
jgi:hypothetical protein